MKLSETYLTLQKGIGPPTPPQAGGGVKTGSGTCPHCGKGIANTAKINTPAIKTDTPAIKSDTPAIKSDTSIGELPKTGLPGAVNKPGVIKSPRKTGLSDEKVLGAINRTQRNVFNPKEVFRTKNQINNVMDKIGGKKIGTLGTALTMI